MKRGRETSVRRQTGSPRHYYILLFLSSTPRSFHFPSGLLLQPPEPICCICLSSDGSAFLKHGQGTLCSEFHSSPFSSHSKMHPSWILKTCVVRSLLWCPSPLSCLLLLRSSKSWIYQLHLSALNFCVNLAVHASHAV